MDNNEIKTRDNISSGSLSRSNRNSKLYRQVYGKYNDLDNLPLEDNTDEIDIDSLKQLLTRSEDKQKMRNSVDFDILETKRRSASNEQVHDINKLLEKARYENKKIRPSKDVDMITSNSRIILETLNTGNYEGNYLDKDTSNIDKKIDINSKTNLEMTRELKNLNRNIAVNSLTEQVDSNSDLSLDLLSDLKPTDNTIVSEPINDSTKKQEINNDSKDKEEKQDDNKPTFKKVKLESDGKDKRNKVKKNTINSEPFFPMDASDTTDIDIIKEPVDALQGTKKIDKDFFTSSYEFSRKDFIDYDDESNGTSNILKIILLVLAIVIFAGVILYFILNYGINK